MKVLLALAIAAALGLAVLLLLHDVRGAPLGPRAQDASGARAPAGSGPAAPAAPHLRAAPAEEPSDDGSAALPLAEARSLLAARADRADDDPRVLVVCVLDPATREPVAGARVRAVDRWDPLAAVRAKRYPDDSLWMFADAGVDVRTDAAGIARLPRSDVDRQLLVEHGDRLALADVAAGAPEVEVLLGPPSALQARVIDRAEALAFGVPVEMVVTHHGATYALLRRESAAPEGLAHLGGAAALMRARKEQEPEAVFGLVLGIAGAGAGLVPIDPERLPSAPVPLVLPPAGPVEVRTVDAGGAPLALAGEVLLLAVAPGTEDGAPGERWHAAELVAGRARFPRVAGDAELRILTGVSNPALWRRTWHREARVAAPAVDLLTVDVPIEVQDRIVGRLLDSDGTPAQERAFTLYTGEPEGGRMTDSWRFRTDADGRFAVELAADDVAPGARVGAAVIERPRRVVERRADATEDVVLLPGATNLGDLRLHAVVALVSGRCVDPAGAPLAGIRVTAQPDPPLFGHQVTTGADGGFELLGGSRRVALHAESDDHVMLEPVVVALGADGEPTIRDVEIRLAPGGAIVASLAPGGAPDGEPLTLSADEQDAGSEWSRRTAFDADGFARAGNLRAGAYRALVHQGGQLLLEVRDVSVRLGADTADPRLQDLRLAGRLRAITLLVVDEAERPVAEPLALVVGDGRVVARAQGTPGRVRIDVAAGAGVRILVTAPGFRPAWLDAHAVHEGPEERGEPEEPGERQVVLRAGIPVRLRSAVRPPTERNGGTALLSLRRVAPEDPTGAFDVEVPLELATDGEALVVFPGPGTYRLGLSKRWLSADGTAYRTIPGYDEPAPEVEVREEDAHGLLAFDLPAVIIPY